ncbi:MAG: PilZ domain-containing protein [Planctomycetes bacterium]|nr:PilZ domain-containing protein [Planctomycetota bacterium]
MMDAERIVKMTPETIHELLASHSVNAESKNLPGKRQTERWPFPGAVEVWLPDECYGEQHVLATLHNLSDGGLAMRVRRPIPSNTRVSLAIHQPELSCYGHALVRHCTRTHVGYLVGVEFFYLSDEDDEAADS